MLSDARIRELAERLARAMDDQEPTRKPPLRLAHNNVTPIRGRPQGGSVKSAKLAASIR